MSTATYLNNRKAVPVYIGSMLIYCEDMSISEKRVIAEASTVSGGGAVTNTAPRCASITLKGRAFNEELPLHNAAQLDSMLRSSTTLTVQYRGLILGRCRILSFTVSDSGLNYVDITVTLSSDSISEPEE